MFLELSEQPGNEDLKERLNKNSEKATKRFIGESDKQEHSNKKQKVDEPSEGSSNVKRTSQTSEESDAKRIKKSIKELKRQADEALQSGSHSSSSSSSNNVKKSRVSVFEASVTPCLQGGYHTNIDYVCDFYSRPGIVPHAIGKYVKSGKRF